MNNEGPWVCESCVRYQVENGTIEDLKNLEAPFRLLHAPPRDSKCDWCAESVKGLNEPPEELSKEEGER